MDNVVLARVYENDQLIGIWPRTTVFQQQLYDLLRITDDSGKINLQKFHSFLDGETKTVPQWQKDYVGSSSLRAKFVQSDNPKVLLNLERGDFSEENIMAAQRLLESGEVRTAEKIFSSNGNGIWHTQIYGVDCMNALFKRKNVIREGGYFDKVPLLTRGWTEEMFNQRGVRFIPTSFVRAGCYIGPGTTIMPQAIVNSGAYIEGGDVMIDGAARVATGAQIGRGVKLGAGSGVEGILEPKGLLPTIIEDKVTIGAMCEIAGIVEEGSIVSSGVIMTKRKKIYDERTQDFQEPRYIQVGDKQYPIPYIPKNRIAVPGSYPKNEGKYQIDCIVLLEKGASESSIAENVKNRSLYM